MLLEGLKPLRPNEGLFLHGVGRLGRGVFTTSNLVLQMPKKFLVQRQDELSEESEIRNRVTEADSTARARMGPMAKISTTKKGLRKTYD